jgi:hypothetical protein
MKEGENQNENKNEVSRSRFSICAATSDKNGDHNEALLILIFQSVPQTAILTDKR